MTPAPAGPDARRPSLFGPLVWWELVRLARRGHAVRSRVLSLYTLLLAVVGFAFVWSYPAGPLPLLLGTADPLPPKDAATFARQLAVTLLEAQLLLVAAITPAYAAAAVAEEKDRHTLALLLTTALTDREIVWGKAVGRVLFVLAAVAAGVPVVALTLLFGVDPSLLAAGYALTSGTVVLSAAIGVGAACHSPDSRTALLRAYGQSAALVWCVLIPPFVLLSPFAMLAYHVGLEPGPLRVAVGFGYPAGQCFIAWMLLAEATRGLRNPGPTAGPFPPTAYPEPPRGRPAPVVIDLAIIDPPPLPPLDDTDPVLWKERHAGRTPLLPVLDKPVRVLGAVAAVLAVALFVGGGWVLVKRAALAFDPVEAERMLDRPDGGGALLVAAGVVASALYLLPLAAGVTGCVAGERFRGTLDPLLTTPLSRWRLLWSKVRAHAERGLVFAGGAAAALGAGFGADVGVRTGLAAVAGFAGGVALVVGVGSWLSVRSPAPVRAFRLCVPVLLAVVGLPVLAWHLPAGEGVPRAAEVLAWGAVASAAAGAALWWRAGAELNRGEA